MANGNPINPIADASGAYGSPDNHAPLVDVSAALGALRTAHRQGRLFSFDTTWTIRQRRHIQGAARLPGIPDENWLVLTKSDDFNRSRAGLIFVQFDGLQSDGNPWRDATRVAQAWDHGTEKHRLTFSDSDHPSGVQVIGCTLAVAYVDRPNAWVSFFSVSDPRAPARLQTLRLDGSRGEPDQTGPVHATSVSIAKLADGRHVLFVYHDRSGTPSRGWFYASNAAPLAAGTTWTFEGAWSQTEAPRWRKYQNTDFLVQADGTLFLAGLGRNGLKQYVDLFRVTTGQTPSGLAFQRVRRKHIHPRPRGGNLRGGAGLHVTRDGRLALYASRKSGLQPMVVEEFRS